MVPHQSKPNQSVGKIVQFVWERGGAAAERHGTIGGHFDALQHLDCRIVIT